MRVDPIVTRMKFEKELALLREKRDLLESRGIFLLGSSAQPKLELVFVPRHALKAIVPVTQQGGLFLPPGARVALDIPSLSAIAFKASFDLSDYDLEPPSLEFLDPWTNSILPYHTMFRALQFDPIRKAHIVLLDDHPITHKPFLCVRGIREYHNHPQHSGDQWLLYRESMNMFSIVMSLWRVGIDLVHPQILLQENGVQIQWNTEEKL